jgi:hypothetical protein
MRYLEPEEVLLIHERILDKFGGAGGLCEDRVGGNAYLG